jgi:thiol-disulfide isomerase/thioredoxin
LAWQNNKDLLQMNASRSFWQFFALLAGSLLVGLVLGLAIFLPSVLKTQKPSNAPAYSETALTVGSPAPDFTLTDTLSGDNFSLAEQKGKPVMLNFWATWCGPCRVEMPTLEAAWQAHASEGLVILAINDSESQATVADFGAELGLTFPLLLDPQADIQSLYRIRAYPTSYFINREGTIRAIHLGVLTPELLAENLATILTP